MSTTPPPSTHMQKLKNFEDPKKTGKDVVQSKMKKKCIVDIRKLKKIVKNVDNTPPPSHTLHVKKSKNYFFFKKIKWWGISPNVMKGIVGVRNPKKMSKT